MAMTKEVELLVEEKLVEFGKLLETSPDGWYYIPQNTIVNYNSQNVRFLTWLLMELCRLYPQYTWTESENLATPGIVISWKKSR